MTAELRPEVFAQLQEQARQNRRTPEEHAAALLSAALSAPLFQPTASLTPAPPAVSPEGPRRLRPAATGAEASAAHHRRLLGEMEQQGATLEEVTAGRWELRPTPEGKGASVDARTVQALLRAGLLTEAD